MCRDLAAEAALTVQALTPHLHPHPCRAKQHLPFLQRAGKMQAVCEYVLSGHRLKLHIPKEGVTIAFNPSGVRCPQRGQPAAAGRPAVEVRGPGQAGQAGRWGRSAAWTCTEEAGWRFGRFWQPGKRAGRFSSCRPAPSGGISGCAAAGAGGVQQAVAVFQAAPQRPPPPPTPTPKHTHACMHTRTIPLYPIVCPTFTVHPDACCFLRSAGGAVLRGGAGLHPGPGAAGATQLPASQPASWQLSCCFCLQPTGLP